MASRRRKVTAEEEAAAAALGERGEDGLFKPSVYFAHMKHYQAVTWRSLLHAASTLALVAVWHVGAARLLGATGDSATPVRAGVYLLLMISYGFIAMRCFMILHDCGHGSFFRSWDFGNTAFAYLFAIFSGTPTDFGPTHRLHHDNVGDMDNDKYDWAETIFHTVEQFKALPKWKQALWKVARHPLVFFTLAPVGLWWVKFRLPFYTGKRRVGTYRPWNKVVNTVSVLTHFYLAHMYAGAPLVWVLFVGGMVGGAGGMILFHLQHVHNPGYQTHGNWNRVRAAIHGSSYLQVPEWMKFFTMGIEYHHIHHMYTKVPGYRLRECHEEAPKGMWQGITRLSYADMWDSMTFTCFNEKKGRYQGFP